MGWLASQIVTLVNDAGKIWLVKFDKVFEKKAPAVAGAFVDCFS